MPPPGWPGQFGPPMFRPRMGGGFLRLVLAALLLVILLDLVGVNLILLAGLAAPGGRTVRKTVVVDYAGDQTIAAIPIDGLITDDTASQFDQYLSAAGDDKNIKAVVLEIDTPGGSASASDAMYHRLERFKAEEKVPVIVAMGGMATSGGYYVACGADFIFAEPTTWTANIGVLMPQFNVSELLAKYGVKETTIVATGADYKNLGSMFQPEDPKAKAYLQGLVDAMFDQFKKVVLDGRHGKLPADTSDIFNGRVYTADAAIKLGLVDKIGYAEDAYEYARTAANLSGAKVVRFLPPTELQRMLGADSIFNLSPGKAELPHNDITINGVSIDLRQLGELLAPRPMYLWRGN
jgi:protease IV